MSDALLCPFSKPIIGNGCRCEHALLSERCSGKMVCGQAGRYLRQCRSLVAALKQASRFVLGLGVEEAELTHAQTMKIRCGGLLGMHRVLELGPAEPEVTTVLAAAESRYGELSRFPFSDIGADIQAFSHRKR